MKILVTGKGSAGSWKIRGEQLGDAIGARVVPKAIRPEIQRADLVVYVKRIHGNFFADITKAGTKWIWDLVDPYPQPICTDWTKQHSIDWVRKQIETFKPHGIIWPNKKMRDDCDDGDTPGAVIYHHHRQNISLNPIRENIQAIGYEGEPNYIADWLPVLKSECKKREWKFLINPPNICDLDIVVAMRGERFNGYAQRSWKSNVKLSNAQGSGTPFIGSAESSYIETGCGAEVLIESESQIAGALDQLVPRETRLQASEKMRAVAYSVDAAARDTLAFIEVVAGG